MTRRLTNVVPIPPAKLALLLKKSVAHAHILKFAGKVVDLEKSIRDGRLGPRTVRARARFLAEEHSKLAKKLKAMGFKDLD